MIKNYLVFVLRHFEVDRKMLSTLFKIFILRGNLTYREMQISPLFVILIAKIYVYSSSYLVSLGMMKVS